jgi:hypothetical protein
MSDPQRPEREAIGVSLGRIHKRCDDWLVSETSGYNEATDLISDIHVELGNILAALPPTPTPGWQDISTAPKDGTFILIYPSSCWVEDVEHDYEVSYWDEDFGRWHFSALPDDYTGPTHWMPLPPAPTGDRS